MDFVLPVFGLPQSCYCTERGFWGVYCLVVRVFLVVFEPDFELSVGGFLLGDSPPLGKSPQLAPAHAIYLRLSHSWSWLGSWRNSGLLNEMVGLLGQSIPAQLIKEIAGQSQSDAATAATRNSIVSSSCQRLNTSAVPWTIHSVGASWQTFQE